MAWLRKDETDEPTGQIAAATIARIVEEVDGEKGTEAEPGSSNTDVQPLQQASDLERALADRQALIQMCLYALDRARSGGVVERLEHGLAEIGVQALRPDGERFDPARHEAGGALPTEDPALEGVVAETEVTGFADHDRVLRAPIVIVYAKKNA